MSGGTSPSLPPTIVLLTLFSNPPLPPRGISGSASACDLLLILLPMESFHFHLSIHSAYTYTASPIASGAQSLCLTARCFPDCAICRRVLSACIIASSGYRASALPSVTSLPVVLPSGSGSDIFRKNLLMSKYS